jgi:tellurite resistance protein TerC
VDSSILAFAFDISGSAEAFLENHTYLGAFLILTGIKILFAPEKPIDPEKNPVIRLLRKMIPVSPQLDGQNFFTRKNGILHATPLFVCLVFLEVTDIIFAVDSVPAVFLITTDPFIVYTSNIFAIMGLRALFFALSAMIHRFHYLKYALALVLVFIGSKIFLSQFIGKIPAEVSLGITASLIIGGVLVSLYVTAKEKKNQAQTSNS